jgi:hypothetical protein
MIYKYFLYFVNCHFILLEVYLDVRVFNFLIETYYIFVVLPVLLTSCPLIFFLHMQGKGALYHWATLRSSNDFYLFIF